MSGWHWLIFGVYWLFLFAAGWLVARRKRVAVGWTILWTFPLFLGVAILWWASLTDKSVLDRLTALEGGSEPPGRPRT